MPKKNHINAFLGFIGFFKLTSIFCANVTIISCEIYVSELVLIWILINMKHKYYIMIKLKGKFWCCCRDTGMPKKIDNKI
jgi:hypothetical protein